MKNPDHLEMINSVVISLRDMQTELERNFGVSMETLKDGLGKGNISTDDWIHDKLGDLLGDMYEGYTEVMDQVEQYVPWYACVFGLGYPLLVEGAQWLTDAIGIPPQPSYNDLLDPDFIHELTRYYGASPLASNNGFLQSLHSNRLWTYEGTGKDGWGRIASAYRSCTALRRRIIHATLNALYAKRNGDTQRAIRWLGHATHIIEDSFSKGHTERDEEMNLTGILFSGWTFPYLEEGGEEPVTVPGHYMIDEKDNWWDHDWAKQADADYLKAASGLFCLLRESPDDFERIRRATVAQLNRYFDPHQEVPNGKVLPGYFNRAFLSHEMPISIERYLSRTIDEPWNILVPLPWSQPGSPPSDKSSLLFSYSTESGKYALDKITSSSSGSLRMTNLGLDVMESGWHKAAPFVGIDGFPWMIAYRKDDGRSALYRVDFSEKKVECVETSFGWPAGLGALVTVKSGASPNYGIGYDRTSTLLYIARLDTLSGGLGTFFQPKPYHPPGMTNPRSEGYNLVTIALCQDSDDLQAGYVPSIIFHNPESGDVRIERILFDHLPPQSPANLEIPATKEIGKGFWEKDSSTAVPYLLERRVGRQTGFNTYLLKFAENKEPLLPTQKIASRPLWFVRLETAGSEDQKVPQYIRAGFLNKRSQPQTLVPLSFRNKPYLLVQSADLLNQESKISIYRIESIVSPYSDVLISAIRYNSQGYDDRSNESLNDEFIEIENDCRERIDLTNWTLHHHTSFIYRFESFALEPGECVRIHSGQGEDTLTDLYMGKGNYVWNNRRDEATLRDAHGAIEDFCEYRRNDREIWVF